MDTRKAACGMPAPWAGSTAGGRRDPWATIATRRDVLLVAHNATTMNRLADIVGVFESDLRVQLAVTSKFSDPFVPDLGSLIAELNVPFTEWAAATARGFDLVISASHHGDLHELRGPLVIFSHGIGYTKYAPEEPGTRNPEPGTRNPEPGFEKRFRSLAAVAGQ